METQGILRPGRQDNALLSLIERALVVHAESEVSTFSKEEAQAVNSAMTNRPLVRWLTLRIVRKELSEAGYSTNAIDWESIGDFLVKIAPIIFEFLRMFM